MIIIKGRQQGVTTLFQLIALALVLKIPGFRSYTMAHDKSLANDVFEDKIKFAWDQFPKNFKGMYKVHRNNVRQLLFDGDMLKSSITVGLSARGGTYQMLHISEPGMMSTLPKTWKEMQTGTLPAGEFADIIAFESTADGGLGEFYKFVKENQKPGSEFKVIFLCWTDTPEYQKPAPEDIQWVQEYKLLARDYELEPNPMKKYRISKNQFFWYFEKAKQLREEVKVQYPFSVEEAFISLAKNYFNIRLVIEAEERARLVEYEEWHGFKIFHKPKPGRTYAVGVDTSTGESNDNTSIQVFDAQTGDQVAVATGKFSEKQSAKMIVDIGYYYNTAYIGVEINFTGRAVHEYIMEYEYPTDRIYKRYITDVTKQRHERVANFGWLTSSVTRPILLADFRNAFEDRTLTINDPETLAEMMVFVNNNGKYEAQIGSNDDRVLGAMIAYQVIKYIIEFA